MDRSGRGLRIAVLALFVVGVGAFVWATNRPEWETVHIEGIVASSDADEIDVIVAHGQCGRDPRVVVVEQSDDAVRLRAEQDVGGDCDSVGLTSEITVELDADLGAARIEVERFRPVGRPEAACVVDGEPDDRCSFVP
jgi:hypothetical protein